jgi:hypothetical protein
MRGAIYNDLIVEKLEIARSIGILTAYLVFPTGREGIIKVWPSARASEEEVKHYITNLLAGLVPDQEITVAPTPHPSKRSR